jgi:DNA-binding IclR family transcriptional regulator
MSRKLLPVARDFETKVLKMFTRMQRHLLIGEISLETGYSLNTVEAILLDLLHRGAIERLADDKRKQVGLHPKTEAFTLVDAQKFTVVPWSDYC